MTKRLREQRGFTMLLAVFVLTITTLMVGGAFMAVLDDTGLSRNDVDQNRAYAAAQAGIQAYNYKLNQNENYWETCTTLGPTTVPGDSGSSAESYTVTPMVATTAPSSDNHCDSANALATMIEGSSSGTASGTFRIKSTGTSGTGTHTVSRTIVAQYKPPSFLNYVYYTDFETTDPSALPGDPSDCEVHYPGRGSDCGGPINFITGDVINGPLHSEDTLAICGSPSFGRTSADTIQAPAYSNEGQSGCANTPNMVGTYSNRAGTIAPPVDDSQLLSVAESGGSHYTGKTTIVLTGATMTVTNASVNGGAPQTGVALPTDGVIYVSTATAGCSVNYTPFNPSYSNDANCGNVYVSGTYSSSLTIASDNDIIIDGNLCNSGAACTTSLPAPTGNAVLGLIANDFVRVYHPVSGSRGSSAGSCSNVNNGTGTLYNPIVYAAILAVKHSFIVDNYDCGGESPSLGTLYVYGAIAQLFRGPVGTGGSGGATSGYIKSYNYDDRLSEEEPPYFLDPASAAWYVSRETECAASASAC